MNADVKRAWLEALRSGEYRKGISRLRQGERYCCLGVLCDLAATASVGRWRHDDAFDDFVDDNEIVSTALPDSVIEWAELDQRSPQVDGIPLVDLNDGSAYRPVRPHTFTEIADLIERYL